MGHWFFATQAHTRPRATGRLLNTDPITRHHQPGPAHPADRAVVCRACKQGTLSPATDERAFYPDGQKRRPVRVSLLTSQCNHCKAKTTLSAQHDENLRRLAARKVHYGERLLGEEILRMRVRFGLTQTMAAKVFGKGQIAFSRYENESTYPDLTMTRLMTLAIEHPVSLKWLADRAGVELPLWPQRCEDAPEILRMEAQDSGAMAVGRRRKIRHGRGATAAQAALPLSARVA